MMGVTKSSVRRSYAHGPYSWRKRAFELELEERRKEWREIRRTTIGHWIFLIGMSVCVLAVVWWWAV